MREAVRVRITAEQYQELRNLLSLSYNMDVRKNYPKVNDLMKQIGDDLLDEPGDLIERARADYKDSDEDIEVDDDAALSRADDGVWVGGWLWVPNETD